MSHSRHKHDGTLLLICLICTGVVAVLHAIGFAPLTIAELALRDTVVTRLGARSPANPELVCLAIDQSSLTLDEVLPEEINASPALAKMKAGWPWARDIYPLIIERLAACGARVVAFDLLFPTPREGDDAFRESLARFGDRVVLGSNFIDADRGSGASLTYALPSPDLFSQPAQSGSLAGYVNFRSDIDGIVRHARYRTTESIEQGMQPGGGEEVLYSFAARIMQKAGLEKEIPVSLKPCLFRFAGDRAFSHWPIYQIFVKKFWDSPQFRGGDYFKGKIVVIGPYGNWSKDYLDTPMGQRAGVDIHLNAINAAMNRDFLYEMTGGPGILLIFAGGLVAWLLSVWIAQPLVRLLALAGAALGFYGVVLLAFNYRGLETVLLGFLFALVSSGLVRLAWEQVIDQFERARTRREMERYVSKDAVREILDNRESFLHSLLGSRKPVTILFSDLRGFTSRSEKDDPHLLVAQLNEYLTEMIRIVFAYSGTLDKFIGDAVMAHWGSITSVNEKKDACRAVEAALEMRASLASLNRSWKSRGIEPLAFGVGINHGEVIVGSFGSHEKKEVSVIGDAVNTASRIEGATKAYRLDIIIGEPVEVLVRDAFTLRSVDCILLHGKTRPVKLFTVISVKGAAPVPSWLAIHEKAMEHYRAGDFAGAESLWREVISLCPDDGLAGLFLQRCAELLRHPPATGWNGVYEMKSK